MKIQTGAVYNLLQKKIIHNLFGKLRIKMWLFFFFFPFAFCFAEENNFFSEINKKPKKIQKKILENRLLFISKRRIDLKIKDTIQKYLKIKNKNNEQINFIISILNKADKEKKFNIEREILLSTIQFCKRSQCIFLLEALLKIKIYKILNKDVRSKILDEKLLDFRNYSSNIAKNPLLLEFFDKLISDDKKNFRNVFLLALKYGKYKYLNKKINEYKEEFDNEMWFQYAKCRLFVFKNEYKKSKICFQKHHEKKHRFQQWYLYSSFLQNEKIKNKDLEKYSSLLGNKKKFVFIIFKIFFLKHGTREIFSDIDLDKLAKNYRFGYYFFMINRHYGMFKGKELEKLKKIYHKKFKDLLLQKILKGDVSKENLAEYFGKTSTYYQFYVNPL